MNTNISSVITGRFRIGFSGSRHYGQASMALRLMISEMIDSGTGAFLVGDAKGFDRAVTLLLGITDDLQWYGPDPNRSGKADVYSPSPNNPGFYKTKIYRASRYLVNGNKTRASFAMRSMDMLAGLEQGDLLVSSPISSPDPRVSPGKQFRGYGSGTWGTTAVAYARSEIAVLTDITQVAEVPSWLVGDRINWMDRTWVYRAGILWITRSKFTASKV